MFVELENFQKLKVGFLLVRHTHDHNDQIFICFEVTLSRNNVGILPSLAENIKKIYSLEPIFKLSKKLFTCKGLFRDHMVKKSALSN